MRHEMMLALYAAMLRGVFPDWDARAITNAGEELRSIMDDAEPAEERNEELARIQQILIDFGALGEDDKTTGIADLLEVLLPPANEP